MKRWWRRVLLWWFVTVRGEKSYVCTVCGGRWLYQNDERWSDEKARAQYQAVFGATLEDLPGDVVCHQCYLRVMGWEEN